MDEKTKKMKFLQLQFCMLMMACTLLPDFWSLLGVPDFDVPILTWRRSAARRWA